MERVRERLESDHARAIRYRKLFAQSGSSGVQRSKRLQVAIQAKLVLDHLRPVLPFDLGEELTASLRQAESSFEPLRRARQVVWTDRIRVVPAGHPLKAPRLDAKVQREVETAIDRGRQLRMRYRRGPDGNAREIVCHPLGLLFRPPVLYLIARTGRRDPTQYALHRMVEAEALASPADTSDFDFDAYLHSGAADMAWSDRPLRLVVAARAAFAKIWDGTPLGDDQAITPMVDEDYPWRISATVPDSHLLRAYLLSLGTEVIVLEPREIADWVVDQATAMAAEIRARLRRKKGRPASS
ncbi:MAG: WYL domain-containing protein [Xanthomonadales bacterium]|nr:WYL domain-containing protein [Xanthomonadales bacterium]